MKSQFPFHVCEEGVLLIVTVYSMVMPMCLARSYNTTLTDGLLTKLSTKSDMVTKQVLPAAIDNMQSNSTIHVDLNQTGETFKSTKVEKHKYTVPGRSESKLPLGLIIASPAVAVGVFIFICIAYKWHSKQLDSQCKELAAKIETVSSTTPCIPSSPSRSNAQAQRFLLPGHAVSDSDLIGQRRKSLRTPTPPPAGLSSKRGSCLSAVSDQEVLARTSPRRHSTFIL